jgi:hypothetical protein
MLSWFLLFAMVVYMFYQHLGCGGIIIAASFILASFTLIIITERKDNE